MTDINIQYCRSILKDVASELKLHNLNAYKDAYVMKNSFGWFFHAPALNFSADYSNRKCDNAYQARYEGWLAYLDKKGLLNNFGAVEDSSQLDK
jgi:hypothetical protein